MLSLACVAIVLGALGFFEWHLKRSDDKLKSELKTLVVVDDQPSPLEVRVAFPDDLLPVLQTPAKFRVTHQVADIPDSVKSAFAKETQKSSNEDGFSMAEPGSLPWNVGDALVPGLPRRRLKAVAVSETLCLVFYEHGGFGKTADVAAFRLSEKEARAVWHSSVSPDVASPVDFFRVVTTRPQGDAQY
jgi:hypothetical protein